MPRVGKKDDEMMFFRFVLFCLLWPFAIPYAIVMATWDVCTHRWIAWK